MAYGWFDSSLIGKVFGIMEDMGIFEYILPWMLYYAIIYGLLSRVNLFGKENSRSGGDNKKDKGDQINRIVALTMATLILYYVPQSRTIAEFLAELFTKWGVFAITLLLIPLTAAILGIKIGDITTDNTTKYIITGVGAVIVFFIFYGTLGDMFKEYWVIIDPYTIAIAITLVILGFIIVSVTGVLSGEGDNDNENQQQGGKTKI